jgi:phosphoglycerate dehydrogenase-like enzyme
MKIAFAGAFAVRLEPEVRAHLSRAAEIVLADEAGIVDKLGDVDVLVTMAFTKDMAAAARRLKLVQVPGAGLDRIDRGAVASGTALAN